MEFRVLGGLRAIADDGAHVRLPSRAQRRLVSALLVRVGRVVPADRLAEQLSLSAGALRTSVSRVRRLLGDDVLVTDAAGYLVRAVHLDSRSFEALVADAASADDVGDRVARLRAALALWNGEAYQEFADEAWAVAEANRLSRLRSDAQETLAELLNESGDHTGALSVLEGVLAAEPYSDRPRELAMLALAQSGRRVEALRLFQQYRRVLVDEVGAEPSEAIVRLERSIAASGPPREPIARLPVASTSFVGRTREIEHVCRLVTDHPLVTITGAGGMGKSRLAIRVADEPALDHLGEVWFVELTRVAAPAAVDEEIARTVGAPSIASGLIDAIATRVGAAGPCLLVLDNAEHVLAATARAAGVLHARCPDLRVLVTSREPLGLVGEQVWRLPPMSAPRPGDGPGAEQLARFDATRLFLERVRSAHVDIAIDAEGSRQIAAICDRLGGLPLALELAAARTRSVPLRWILEGVETALAVLDPEPGGADRHQSLRASIAWSVDLLAPELREALGRLSVFRSPFTADAAAAIITPDGAGTVGALPVLIRLCDKSLIQFDPRCGRYHLLETIRDFASTMIADNALCFETAARHCSWFGTWCTEIGEGRHGIDRAVVLAEMPDVVAAMEWARRHDPERAMQMCVGLGSIRTTLGHHDNLLATWQWLLGPDGPPRSALWASAVASLMAAATGARLEVEQVVPQVEAHLAARDARARGWLARGRAMVPAYRGDLGPIVDYSNSVVAREDDVEASVYLGFAAYMLALGGRLAEARRLVRHLHQVTRRHSTPFSVDSVGNGYAAAVLIDGLAGRLAEAVELGDRPTPEDPAFSMTAAAALAHAALLTGDRAALDRALEWARRGTIPLLRYLGTEVELSRALAHGDVAAAAAAARLYLAQTTVPLGAVHRCGLVTAALLRHGDIDEASAATGDAVAAVSTMTGVPWLEASVKHAEGQLARAEGRIADLRRHATELLELAERHGFAIAAIDAQELLAAAAEQAGDRCAAERLRTTADASRVRLGYRFHANPSR